ncbi:hypothetical protein JCM5353_001398 [Sporobolomyces roseus]
MSLRRSTPATPPATSSPYADSASEASDYGQPQAKPVSQNTANKSPSVKKSPSVFKRQRGGGSAQSSEPLVKASRKQKPDKTRGAYAPVPLPSSQAPRSSSEFSDDPENQPPSRRQQQPPIQGESESDFEQEEEKVSRPAQTKGERRKRLMWSLIAGGACLVVITIIIVLILVLHSPETDADKDSSNKLNSTSESDQSSNSTSSLSHNATASSNSTLSHSANSTSSLIEGLDLESSSATSTNFTSLPTATDGAKDLDTFSDSQASLTGLESLPTPTPTRSGNLESAVSTDSELVEDGTTGSAQSQVDNSMSDEHGSSSLAGSSFESLDTLDSLATPTLSIEAPSSETRLTPGNSLSPTEPQDENAQHADQGVLSQPSQADHNYGQDMNSISIETPRPSFVIAPISSISYGNIGEPSKTVHETPAPASPTVSAWWPLVTGNGGTPEDATESTTEGNSTKWNGKGEASNACQSTFEDADFVVALSSDLYGQDDSISSLCGAKVQVWNGYTNETRDATVVGSCSDCEVTDINLSKSLFSELDNPDLGILDVQWWFDNATVAESIELDLSKFESTATQDETTIYDTTAIFWKQTGWKSICGQKVEDDSMFIGLPLTVWPEPSKASEYCKKRVIVQNADSDLSIEVEVAEASNRTDYTTFTKKAFEALGGDAQTGELQVKFSLKD